jgi:hypothetical protein
MNDVVALDIKTTAGFDQALAAFSQRRQFWTGGDAQRVEQWGGTLTIECAAGNDPGD